MQIFREDSIFIISSLILRRIKMFDVAIINGNIYNDNTFVTSNLYIKNNKIDVITNQFLDANEVYCAKDKYVLPGFIDPHVHFSLDVLKYKSSDDFYEGSIAAA